ncbi:MAG: matrixin family metalloprotease [Candidatus Diapherotrites archaeon]
MKFWKILAMCLIFAALISVSVFAAKISNADISEKENPFAEIKEKNQEQMSTVFEKIIIVHYANGKGKIEGGRTKETTCYGFLGKDLKWKGTINYYINPTNAQGLSEDFVLNAIDLAAQEWDNHTSAALFGNYQIDESANFDDAKPDGRNEMSFGNYKQSGVIAVTVIWGIFSGKNRQITEFDILFDTDFNWGDATADKTKMDLQNIATHEIGHGLGLKDLYNSTCTEETMYGYSTEGETKKRDLGQGDIKGLQLLYGS